MSAITWRTHRGPATTRSFSTCTKDRTLPRSPPVIRCTARPEARATARLNHPNCVALVDFGIDEGAPYLVMEYVEGKTLADLLDHGAVRPERAVEIARQLLAGLEHAHERGILHRDLKPANVMIVDMEGYPGDFVKLLDFG